MNVQQIKDRLEALRESPSRSVSDEIEILRLEEQVNVQQRQAIERKIVGQVIDAAFAKGYIIRIDNGGDEDEIIVCRTPEEAKANIMQTDEEYLHLFKWDVKENKWTGYGWVWCVYGNDGFDVIADYSTSEVMKEIMDPIDDLAEQRKWWKL